MYDIQFFRYENIRLVKYRRWNRDVTDVMQIRCLGENAYVFRSDAERICDRDRIGNHALGMSFALRVMQTKHGN